MKRYSQVLTVVALVSLPVIVAAAQTAVSTAPSSPALQPVSAILTEGLRRTLVVMMNEAHSDLHRSIRTRALGLMLLPRAHALGVRYLAAEALTGTLAAEANATRMAPVAEGYLAQDDMREFLQAALDLGWTLIAYEPNSFPTFPKPVDGTNWREAEQARNLTAAIRALPSQARILVWCGNSHLMKVTAPFGNDTFRPMGLVFSQISGIDPFVIDQTVTVDFDGSGTRGSVLLDRYRASLKESPLLALGFLEPDAKAKGIDAKVVSLDNTLR